MHDILTLIDVLSKVLNRIKSDPELRQKINEKLRSTEKSYADIQ